MNDYEHLTVWFESMSMRTAASRTRKRARLSGLLTILAIDLFESESGGEDELRLWRVSLSFTRVSGKIAKFDVNERTGLMVSVPSFLHRPPRQCVSLRDSDLRRATYVMA